MAIDSLVHLLIPAPWVAKAGGWCLASLLGGSFLCLVALEVGPATGTAIVHVVEPDVAVTVGGATVRVEDRRYDPLVVEIPRGRRRLVMRRGERVLHDEWFEVGGGDFVVLTAWDSAAAKRR